MYNSQILFTTESPIPKLFLFVADLLNRSNIFSAGKGNFSPLLEIVKKLEVYIQELQPNIVYTHYKGDLNIDHQVTYQAVMTACRPTPRSSITQIYLFEILSSTEWSIASTFSPTHFVDISDEFELKIKALKMYKEEIKDFPNSRSIESLTALSVFRGGSMGLNFAEAFSVERSLA